VNDELERIWKEAAVAYLILRYYPGICLERLRQTIKNLSEDSLTPGRDLNPDPPEYEARVLTTWPQRSVKMAVVYN
jgi:hypothetical protein